MPHLLCLSLLILLIVYRPLGARVLAVPGTFITIAAALEVNLPGDTIEVAPGNHHVTTTLGLDLGVTLRAAQPGTAQLLFNGDLAWLRGGENSPPVRVENLVLRRVAGYTPFIQCEGSLIEVVSCRLVGGDGVFGFGCALVDCTLDSLSLVVDGYYYSNSNTVFFNCQLRDCGVLDSAEHPGCILESCLLLRCGRLGNRGWVSWDEGRIALHGCTLVDCGMSGSPMVGTSLDHLEMSRCIVTGQRGPFLGAGNMGPDLLEVTQSNIWGGLQGDWTQALAPFLGQYGNISEDPLFCAAQLSDYRLSWDSPCILDSLSGDLMGSEWAGCVPRILDVQASIREGLPPLSVDFSCETLGLVDQITWDVDGDGITDGDGPTIHWIYPRHGRFRVTVRVRGSGEEVMSDTLFVQVGGRQILVPDSIATLAEALERARPGDLVQLASGRHLADNLRVPSGVWIFGTPGSTIIEARELRRAFTVDTDTCVVEFRDLTFLNGFADRGGALVVNHLGGGDGLRTPSLRLNNCRFTSNQASGQGGAIANQSPGPRIELDHCEFIGNSAGIGGAIHGGRLLAHASRFESNTAVVGGALAEIDSLDVDACAFLGNAADAVGGAVKSPLFSGWRPRFQASIFSRNRAGQDGAAIWDAAGARISNCTFWGDSTAVSGAVLKLQEAAFGVFPYIENCILANSTGGQVVDGSPSLTLICTDLWDNIQGDWNPPYHNQAELNGNRHVDPLLCGPAEGNFRLMVFSPCNESNSLCGLMGADDGMCEWTELQTARPTSHALDPPWPNPFNPTTTLAFHLDRQGNASLRILNLAGQEVAELVRGLHAAGGHRVVFDGSTLASGMYLAMLETEQGVFVEKMLLVK